MEKPKFKWSDFAGRRRLVLSSWAQKHGLKTYEDLVVKCELLGVEPPKKEQVAHVLLDKETINKRKRAEAAKAAREARKKKQEEAKKASALVKVEDGDSE
jgi:hypothetical protein